MKIGVAVSGLDHAYRGFETFSSELFRALKGRLPVDLLKGSGPVRDREIRVPCLNRSSRFYDLVPPARKFGMNMRCNYEESTFTHMMLPLLLAKKYDVIFCSQPGIEVRLRRLRRWFRLGFKIVFSNAGPFSCDVYEGSDLIHHVTPVTMENDRKKGFSEERMFFVPYGFFTGQYDLGRFDRAKLRLKYGIGGDRFVVLSAAALCHRKNLKYLLNEFSHLDPGKFFLLLAGQSEAETSELEAMAARVLKGNFRFLSVSPPEMPELYALADMMASPSLFEGFGRALAEAMAASLPVAHHDDPIMNWVAGPEACRTNMTAEGSLRKKVLEYASSADLMREVARQNLERVGEFDWERLVPSYVRLFEKAAGAGPGRPAARRDTGADDCLVLDVSEGFEACAHRILKSRSEFTAFTEPSEIDPPSRIAAQKAGFGRADALVTAVCRAGRKTAPVMPETHEGIAGIFLNQPEWLKGNWLWKTQALRALIEGWRPMTDEAWHYELFLRAALRCRFAAPAGTAGAFIKRPSGRPAPQRQLLERYFEGARALEILWGAISQQPRQNGELYRRWRQLADQTGQMPEGPGGWSEEAQRRIMICIHEPAAGNFNRVASEVDGNPMLKNLCHLGSLHADPDQPGLFFETSEFWKERRGRWPAMPPSKPDRRVTVVITTYNRPHILKNALRSVLSQNVEDMECIVVNDGGCDEARQSVEGFKDPRLAYYRIDHAGQAAALNFGILKSRGKALVFLDDDDILGPDYLNRCMEVMVQRRAAFVYGTAGVMRGRYRPDGTFIPLAQTQRYGYPYSDRAARDNCVFNNLGMFRRSLLGEAGLFDETLPWGWDWEFHLRCSERSRPQFDRRIRNEARKGGDNMCLERWHQGYFWECLLMSLYHRSVRGSLVLYIASLFCGEKKDRDYWRDRFMKGPSSYPVSLFAGTWSRLRLFREPDNQEVIRKFLADNPVAALRTMAGKGFCDRSFISGLGVNFFRSLPADCLETAERKYDVFAMAMDRYPVYQKFFGLY